MDKLLTILVGAGITAFVGLLWFILIGGIISAFSGNFFVC